MKLRSGVYLLKTRKPLKRFSKLNSSVNPKLKLGENESFASGSLACPNLEPQICTDGHGSEKDFCACFVLISDPSLSVFICG